MTPATVRRLTDLAAYQEGSIVSRPLLHKKTGNVTLFAFDQGQQLSEHTSPFDALVFVLEGEARIEIAGQPFDLRQGDTILMSANQPHAVHAPLRMKMCLMMIL